MCGQHNFSAYSAGDNIRQNTDKGHTPNPRTEIKIPDPAGNLIRAAKLEGRDSTDHATALDNNERLTTSNDLRLKYMFTFSEIFYSNKCFNFS